MDNVQSSFSFATIDDQNSADNQHDLEVETAAVAATSTNSSHGFAMISSTVEFHREEGQFNPYGIVHSHNHYEVIFCKSNSGTEYLVGSERFSLQFGDVLLIPPQVTHVLLVHSQSQEPYSGYNFWCSRSFVADLHQYYPIFKNLYRSRGCQIRTVGTMWEHLESVFLTGIYETDIHATGWESARAAVASYLLTQLCRAMDASFVPATSKRPELLPEVLAYVESTLADRINTEEIARRFWVSPSTIAVLFKNNLGVSFYKYVTQLRLRKAINYIQVGIPIEKAAAKVGFGDYSAFYRAFKKEYGISPREFSKTTLNSSEVRTGETGL